MGEIQIDKKTYKIGENNYYGAKHKKTQIILGDSNRQHNYHIFRLKKKDFGLSKKWPTFSIRRNGSVFQHYDPQFYSDYLGNKDVDKKSISIVLENMGALYFNNENNTYTNWINEICEDSLVFEKLWKNHRYWENYLPQQYLSLTLLINKLMCDFEIKRNCMGYSVFDEKTISFEGVVCRSNYNSDYYDLNPSFSFTELLKRLNIKYDGGGH